MEHVIMQIHRGIPSFDVVLLEAHRTCSAVRSSCTDGRRMLMTYPCFNLSHADITNVNAIYLIPRGYRINKVTFRGFLPGKNGVLVTLDCERLAPTNPAQTQQVW